MSFSFKMVINKNVIYFLSRGPFSVNAIILLKKDVVKENIMVKNPSRQTSWIFVGVAEELNSEPPRAPSASSGTVLVNMTTGLKVDCAYLFGTLSRQ